MPKLIITRSFSKTKQLGAYEPINASCSIQEEIEDAQGVNIAVHSMELDRLCRQEVQKTIESEIQKHAVEVERQKEANTF